MRWILVFIVLYIIPMWVLFTNYKSFKRACIYGCIYITLSTSLVISNIYLSGLKVLEETLGYEDNVALETYIDNSESIKIPEQKDDIEENESKNTEQNKDIISEKKEDKNLDIVKEKDNKASDLEQIYKFKKEIYHIEKIALIPMRQCLTYTNNLQKSLANLTQVKEDVIYARQMCQEIIDIYEKMEVPNLSKEEYTESLDKARLEVVKTYKLRALAMEKSIDLIETKNPMYISKITTYLKQSDKEIDKFKEEIRKLKSTIKNN